MKITLTDVLHEKGMVYFRVECEPRPEFGWNRSCTNGIQFRSVLCPAWISASSTLFLLGTHVNKDANSVSATESDFTRIQAAVAESNAMDGHVEPKEVTLEDRIAELEERVAALESADDQVQDDAGNGDAINVGATPGDSSLSEQEQEPKRCWANWYANGTASMHNTAADANHRRVLGFDRCVAYVEAEAYDRLKAERDVLRERLTERTEEATKHLHSIELLRAERDVLREFVIELSQGRAILWGKLNGCVRDVTDGHDDEWSCYIRRLAKHCIGRADTAAGRMK